MLYKSKIEILKNGLIRVYDYDKPLQCKVSKVRDDYSKNEEKQSELNINKSLNRTRNNLKNLIDNNVSQFSKFITLTYKATELDRKQVLIDFNRFSDRFEYHYHERPRYVAILEHQKERGKKECNEGSYHIHMILFNDSKIDFKFFESKIWVKGSCNTKKVDSTANLGRYLMKYITKEMVIQEHVFNKKNILRSHNLQVVEPIYNKDNMQDVVEQIPNIKLEYKKNYDVKCFERDSNTHEVIEVKTTCTLLEYKTIK